jgi:hypothetical protein
MRSYDTMSESERRQLDQVISGLSGLQPVPSRQKIPMGRTTNMIAI